MDSMAEVVQPKITTSTETENSYELYFISPTDNAKNSTIYFESSVAKSISRLDSNTPIRKSKLQLDSDSDDDPFPDLVSDSDIDSEAEDVPLFTLKTANAYKNRKSESNKQNLTADTSTNSSTRQSQLADFFPYLNPNVTKNLPPADTILSPHIEPSDLIPMPTQGDNEVNAVGWRSVLDTLKGIVKKRVRPPSRSKKRENKQKTRKRTKNNFLRRIYSNRQYSKRSFATRHFLGG